MGNQKKKRHTQSILVALIGFVAVLGFVSFVCFQPGLQPSSYRISPKVCPPGHSSLSGFCALYRGDNYVWCPHPSITHPCIFHISRAPASGRDDTFTTIMWTGGKWRVSRGPMPDGYPPQNRVDAFVQAVRDRRTELYSEMGWPDPNPNPDASYQHSFDQQH